MYVHQTGLQYLVVRIFFKTGVIKNFTGIHLCWILFLILLKLQTCNIIKQRLQHVFFCGICKSFKNTFFTEHLRLLLLQPTFYILKEDL